MAGSQISYLWSNPRAAEGFASGVSLHSHTSQSKETLDFLANLGNRSHLIRKLLRFCEERAMHRYGFKIDYAAGYWTPPLTPRLAFDLESKQIEKLNISPLVSISDHDNITAPMLLRTVAAARHIPVSVEWSAPSSVPMAAVSSPSILASTTWPATLAAEWMRTFEEYTASPSDARLDRNPLCASRAAQCVDHLHDRRWDLYLIGDQKHRLYVDELMANGEICALRWS